MEQLRKLRIFNPWEFCLPGGFYLSYVRHSRFTMGSSGWWVHYPSNDWQNPRRFQHGYPLTTCLLRTDGRSKPDDMREEITEALSEKGLAWPSGWVRFMSVWMPEDFYTRRMSALVEHHKRMPK